VWLQMVLRNSTALPARSGQLGTYERAPLHVHAYLSLGRISPCKVAVADGCLEEREIDDVDRCLQDDTECASGESS
jgi:hypothetical protein